MSAVAIGRATAVEQTHTFEHIEPGHYRLTIMPWGIQFDIDRLRRNRDELIGELRVACDLAGAKTIDGLLSVSDWNVSSDMARGRRASFLAQRARTTGIDWGFLLEEFAQRTLNAERAGTPARPLSTYPRPGPDSEWLVDRWPLLRDHATIAFGDGGSAKSYLALYVAGQLARRGQNILYADWELEGQDHRERLERLFGADMPVVHYIRCERPLIYEADRLQQDIRRLNIQYLICDSIAFACAGPPEGAEQATGYFRALRQLHVGSLHLAHVNRSLENDQKPFGSSFWHHSARATWFIKQADATTADTSQITIGLFNRKSNLSVKRPAIGFEFAFSDTHTSVRSVNPVEVTEFAAKMPIWQRVQQALKANGGRPMTVKELAEELNAKENSIRQLTRDRSNRKSMFVLLPGGDGTRMALAP